MRGFSSVFTAYFVQCIKSRSNLLVSLGFLLAFGVLAGMGLGAQALSQPKSGIGLLWLGLLLALHVSLHGQMQREEEQGILLQMQLLPMPLGALLMARHLGVWVAVLLPLVFCMPILGVIFGLDAALLQGAALCLLLGSWSYSLLQILAETMLLGASARSAGLSLLMTLPLGVPLLIFGTEASLRVGESYGNAILFLGAIALAMTAVAPWCLAGMLRQYRAL